MLQIIVGIFKRRCKFVQQINVKIVNLVSIARIWTRDLSFIGLTLLALTNGCNRTLLLYSNTNNNLLVYTKLDS